MALLPADRFWEREQGDVYFGGLEGGPADLAQAMELFQGGAQQDPRLGMVNSLWRANTPQLSVDVDRERAQSLAVSLDIVPERGLAGLGDDRGTGPGHAAAGLVRSHHAGALGQATERLARAGMLAMMFTNAPHAMTASRNRGSRDAISSSVKPRRFQLFR